MGFLGGRGRRHSSTLLLSSFTGKHSRAAAGRDPELARVGRLSARSRHTNKPDLQGLRVHPFAGPKDASLSFSVAYDAIAETYDDQVLGDAWMRNVLHAHFRRVFRAGDRILDVGCGTGIDAIALGRYGVRVVGVDGSTEMIARMRAKIEEAGLANTVEASVLNIQDLGSLEHDRFDGLISAFASLSSLPDLHRFAEDAARLVRPGGRLVLHMLNRFSLWEWLGYVARGDWPAAQQAGPLR